MTLKIRTGWDKDSRNAVKIARLAEQSGIAALTVHGRTRACAFKGAAEYDTIKAVKAAGSRYFCESLFWASQPKQAAKT